MSVAELLLDAKDLLNDGWSRDAFARDDDGNPVPVQSIHASSFCIIGALIRAAGSMDDAAEAIQLLASAFHDTSINKWNDDPSVTFEDMIACVNETIATAKAHEGIDD